MKRLAILVPLTACMGGGSMPSESFVELENEGIACLFGGPRETSAARELALDQPIRVEVQFEGVCLSSSCTRSSTASCTVDQSARTFTIETRASWFDTSAAALGCTADCGLLAATCESPALAAGDVTFVLDGHSVELTIPSTLEATPCIGMAP